MELSLSEKRAALKRVLEGRQFSKAPKKADFLNFVCEQSFSGNAGKLNEYLIGLEVYDRGSDFDAQRDPIVRVQAHDIRRGLREYYESEGKNDPVRIELPAGHYVPAFIRVAGEAESSEQPVVPEKHTASAPASRFARVHGLLTAGLLVTCVVLAALLLRIPGQVPTPGAADPSLPESARWFWAPFLPPGPPPLIVIPTHPLLRAAHDGDTAATRARAHLIPKEDLPEFRDTVHFHELPAFYFVPSTTDFTAVGETLGLLNFFELFNSIHQKVRVKAARLIDYEEVKHGNTILLGGNQPWSGRIFTYPEGFRMTRSVIENQKPRPGELAAYKPQFDPITNSLVQDYALVLMLPNEDRSQRILLVYGIYTQGSQAAIEYVTSADRLQELRGVLVNQTRDRRPPKYFQVLLSTTVENYVPGKSTLVATRIIDQ